MNPESDRAKSRTFLQAAQAHDMAAIDNLKREILQQIKYQNDEADKLIKDIGAKMKVKATDMVVCEKNDSKLKQLGLLLGGQKNTLGRLTEVLFFDAIKKGQKGFFGENFDEIFISVKGLKTKTKYNIVLKNGNTIAIIEVKMKAHVDDISEIIDKARTFRINFPEFKHYGIYVGLASLMFYEELEQKCIEKGIAIIKKENNDELINSQNIKKY
jgi:hypothetical protein